MAKGERAVGSEIPGNRGLGQYPRRLVQGAPKEIRKSFRSCPFGKSKPINVPLFGRRHRLTTPAILAGNMEWGEVYMGTVSGLINEIKSAGDVPRKMVAGVGKILARLEALNTNPAPARS